MFDVFYAVDVLVHVDVAVVHLCGGCWEGFAVGISMCRFFDGAGLVWKLVVQELFVGGGVGGVMKCGVYHDPKGACVAYGLVVGVDDGEVAVSEEAVDVFYPGFYLVGSACVWHCFHFYS